MLTILMGRDWVTNREEIFRLLAQDVKNRKAGRILIVPELISHEAERMLCMAAGDTSSRYAEVVSFTRLAGRVSDSMGLPAMRCLDKGGRVVAMAAAARQLAGRLKAYASVETRPEFLTGLIDGIDEFKRCCISPEDLRQAAVASDGSFAQKLEELSLLMEAYDSLCSQGKRDPRDQMNLLLEQLQECDYGENHVFYVDGFPDFTRQNLAILEYLMRVSPNVIISLNCDQEDSHLLAFEKAGATARLLIESAKRQGVPVEIRHITERKDALSDLRRYLYQGPIPETAKPQPVHTVVLESVWQEVLAAALRVQSLVREGYRYRDIGVVLSDVPGYNNILGLVFSRMHIPIYRAGKEDILQKGMIATVLTALDAALDGFEQRSVLQYLRSPLSPLDQDTCDLVENYAVIWGVRGNRWLSPWQNHPDGLSGQWDEDSTERLRVIEEARKITMEPLAELSRDFRETELLRDQVHALYRFLQKIQLEKTLADMAARLDECGDNRSAQILDQLWEILLTALEQLHDILGDTQWDAEYFCRLLRLLLCQYDVGTIPSVLDAVQSGPVTAMRCNMVKHLIVLGAQEGNLPGYNGSNGVLTDKERNQLRRLGVPLTGGAMEGIQEEFAEIYGVFCGALESVWVSCCGEQSSFLFRRLEQLSGGSETANLTVDLSSADAWEAGAWAARWHDAGLAYRLGVEAQYHSVLKRAEYTLGTIAPEHIRSLYGKQLNLSASQVDTQADCRLAYFLKYGLRARERKEAMIDPAEFGTYVHDVLEKTVGDVMKRGGFARVPLDETLAIAHEYSRQYAQEHFASIESQRVHYLFQRNLQELDVVIRELWEELKDSLFQPADFEVGFGSREKLPAIAIPNSSIPASLQGFVDRMDIWHSPGGLYYRVVDYKTGKKEFDYCDVFNGVGLQMLLYLFALENSGHEKLDATAKGAGVLYFPARAPYQTVNSKNDEKVDRKRQSEWQRKGLLLRDEQVLQAMEPGDNPVRMCYTYKKGELEGDLADREQLKLLRSFVFHVLDMLVSDIASGNVSPNPYTRGSYHNACRYCPYTNICHPDSVEGRRNYKTMNAQRFWEEVAKEMNQDGRNIN